MEALLVIAAVIAIVWGAVVFLRGGLIGGCLAVLLAGVCFSVPFYKIEVGPLPLTADRILLVLLVVQYIFRRRWGLADPKPLGKPEVFLLLFLGLLVASTFTHDWKAKNYQPAAWLVISYLMPATMYWITRQMKLTERTINACDASQVDSCATAYTPTTTAIATAGTNHTARCSRSICITCFRLGTDDCGNCMAVGARQIDFCAFNRRSGASRGVGR